MDNLTRRRLATRAVHSGLRPSQGDFVSTVVPIYQSSTFSYRRLQDLDGVFAGTRSGYVYARYGNPTVAALEGAIALLEEGEAALAFASGMAAIHAALLAIGARAGSAIVAAQDIYGATYTLLAELLSSQGVQVRFVDINDLDAVSLACSELRPVALIAESISNPLLKIADVPALAEIAHRCNATLLVDNTFATPTLIQPLTLGADMVIHSVTKYLGGHGDVLGGAVVASSERVEALQKVLKLTGGNLGPQDAWLVLRGIRTLPLRMRQHCENALQLARWLETQDQIERVIYPGLPSHPQHALANRLFGDRGYGGMLSFELTGAGQEDVFRFFETLQLCIPATSLGDTCSLMLYPAHSSHRSLTPEARAHIGISEGLVRMSVGIEAISDLQEDLSQALKAYRNA